MTPSTASTTTRYSGTAILLHWLLGAGLLGLVVVGVYMSDLPFSPQRLKLYNWHKWAGICILVLSVVRLAWRLTHKPPELPIAIATRMTRWQSLAHQGMHVAMYVLFFLVPLIGWAYSSAAGFPVVVFGVLTLPDFVPVSKELAEAIKPLHALSAFALVALIAGHILAALKHQWIDRDSLMERILPGRS